MNRMLPRRRESGEGFYRTMLQTPTFFDVCVAIFPFMYIDSGSSQPLGNPDIYQIVLYVLMSSTP